jgi:hypothetical protein
MAAFFAINIDSFAFNNDGKLPLGYVLKYMCKRLLWLDLYMLHLLTTL